MFERNGHDDEKNEHKTDRLISMVLEREELRAQDLCLVSQWAGDRSTAKTLGIRTILTPDEAGPRTALTDLSAKTKII